MFKQTIKHIIGELKRNHKTNNPFELADAENILVLKEKLGSINGYYSNFYDQKMIHINCDLDERLQLFVCAHELGHAMLHPNSNTPLLRCKTFYSINKLEKEANLFAAYLLVDKRIYERYLGYTIDNISRIERIPLELLKMSFNLYNEIKL